MWESALADESVASNGLRLDDLDAAKVPETEPTFFHSTLDGTHAHVEFACHRFEATPVAHEGIDHSPGGFALASHSCKVSSTWMGATF